MEVAAGTVAAGAVVGTGVSVGAGTGVSVGEELWLEVGAGVSVGFEDEVGPGVGVLVGVFLAIVGTFLGSVGEGSMVGERKGMGVAVGSTSIFALPPRMIEPPPKRRIMPSTAPPIKIIWFW